VCLPVYTAKAIAIELRWQEALRLFFRHSNHLANFDTDNRAEYTGGSKANTLEHPSQNRAVTYVRESLELPSW